MTLSLAWPWVLAVAVLPLAVARLLPRAAGPAGAALRLPFYAGLQAALGERRTGSRWRLPLAAAAWLLLVLAAARPQLVGEPLTLPVSGRDLLLAVDISGSMETPDMQLGSQVADRLTAVKAVAGEFIERREGDRLGLILFGEQAYLQAPLTFDRRTVRTLLNEAAIGLAGKSTAIGDAIGLAVKRLRGQDRENRVLILLTDGANTAGSIAPRKAADIAAAEGLRIYTIGVGAGRRSLGGLLGGLSIANNELDEPTLQAIAAKTGGRYFRARDIEGLAEIYALLDELEPAGEEEVFRPVRELYTWPLAVALLISILLAAPLAGLRLPHRAQGAGRA